MDERTETIEIMPFGEEKEIIDTALLVANNGQKGHGGGDSELINNLYRIISGEESGTTTLKESMECHLIGIAAEESRLHGGSLVSVHG